MRAEPVEACFRRLAPFDKLREHDGTSQGKATSSGRIYPAYCAYGANGARCFTKWSEMMR